VDLGKLVTAMALKGIFLVAIVSAVLALVFGLLKSTRQIGRGATLVSSAFSILLPLTALFSVKPLTDLAWHGWALTLLPLALSFAAHSACSRTISNDNRAVVVTAPQTNKRKRVFAVTLTTCICAGVATLLFLAPWRDRGEELRLAAYEGDVVQVKSLLKHYPKVVNAMFTYDMRGPWAETPPEANSRPRFRGYLIDWYTPLEIAAAEGRLEVAEALLAAHADVSDRALWHAVLGGHTQVMQLLLAHGANANVIEPQGHRETALILAVRTGRIDAVKLLLANGADVNVEDVNFGTPMGYAKRDGRTDIANLLRQYGAR
jgi:hypothetical protein